MSVEAQHLLQQTVQQFTVTITAHTTELVTLTKASAEQTDKVADLTRSVRTLTVVIAWLTGAAVLFGGIQAVAVIVRFVRWWNGWL